MLTPRKEETLLVGYPPPPCYITRLCLLARILLLGPRCLRFDTDRTPAAFLIIQLHSYSLKAMSFLCTPRTHTVGLSYTRSSTHMCKLGTRWRRVFSFTSHPPYTQVRNPRYQRSRRRGGLEGHFGLFGDEIKSLTPASNQSITYWSYCS